MNQVAAAIAAAAAANKVGLRSNHCINYLLLLTV
jgi:hypothetical protein